MSGYHWLRSLRELKYRMFKETTTVSLFLATGTSPERGVSEGGTAPELSGSHGELFPVASLPRGSEVSSRLLYHEQHPESVPDLYNLTQLAEVSLAAAAGHIFRPTPSKLEVRNL